MSAARLKILHVGKFYPPHPGGIESHLKTLCEELSNSADVEVLAGRYRGRRGIRRVIGTIALVDAGAESPRETWLRLLLIRDGFPPPTTQIRSTVARS